MHRNRIQKLATGAVAILALAITAQPGGSPASALNASALRHAPDKVDRAPDATAASQSSTPLGAPPSDQQAKPRNDGGHDGDVKKPGAHSSDNEENSNPTSTKYMTYRGGAVQSSPRVYLVFWGSNWFNGGDPYGVANRLHYLYQGLGGSGWSNVLKQYGSNYGTFTNPSGQYKGWIQDTSYLPSRPTSTDMANAAIRAANRMGDSGYLAQYVIATPWGAVDQYTLSAGACAWHSYAFMPNTSNWVTYTSMPYTPYLDSNLYNCGGSSVNGSSGRLDGVTIVAGHEYAESINDPGMNGWKDSDGSENGDKCAWRNLANRPLANGYTFPMQPTWSNQWRQQYGYGCYYS